MHLHGFHNFQRFSSHFLQLYHGQRRAEPSCVKRGLNRGHRAVSPTVQPGSSPAYSDATGMEYCINVQLQEAYLEPLVKYYTGQSW